MKKLIQIGFLLALLCSTVTVYAEGEMSTGNKTCTQNCSGLYDAPSGDGPAADIPVGDESTIDGILSWVFAGMAKLIA